MLTRRLIGMRIAALTLAISMALAACGGGTSPPAASPDDPVSAAPTKDPGQPRAQLREPTDGLVDVNPRRFETYVGHGKRVTLFYYSGPEECYGLDHVEVDETDERVVVTIFEGRRAEAEICPEIAVWVRSVVSLDRPLGDRNVVNGAR